MMKFIEVGPLNLKDDFEKTLPSYCCLIVEESTGNLWEFLNAFHGTINSQTTQNLLQHVLNQSNSGGECGIDVFFM